MRTLHRNDREQVNVSACFRNLDNCCQSGKAAANHDNSGIYCHELTSHSRAYSIRSSGGQALSPCKPVSYSLSHVEGGGLYFSPERKNEPSVAKPTTMNTKAIAPHTNLRFRRDFSLTVMPHFAQKR